MTQLTKTLTEFKVKTENLKTKYTLLFIVLKFCTNVRAVLNNLTFWFVKQNYCFTLIWASFSNCSHFVVFVIFVTWYVGIAFIYLLLLITT